MFSCTCILICTCTWCRVQTLVFCQWASRSQPVTLRARSSRGWSTTSTGAVSPTTTLGRTCCLALYRICSTLSHQPRYLTMGAHACCLFSLPPPPCPQFPNYQWSLQLQIHKLLYNVVPFPNCFMYLCMYTCMCTSEKSLKSSSVAIGTALKKPFYIWCGFINHKLNILWCFNHSTALQCCFSNLPGTCVHMYMHAINVYDFPCRLSCQESSSIVILRGFSLTPWLDTG